MAQDTSPDNFFANAYLPKIERMKNVGGSDGSGLCVFTSLEHAAREQGIDTLRGFRAWMEKRPGGGYPSKVDKMLADYCREKGVPLPRYVQVTVWDPELMAAALRSGRMVSLTYGKSPTGRYGGGRINHMVNLEHGGQGDFWGILDNNYIDAIEWLNLAELKAAHTLGGAWFVVFVDGGAPPKLKVRDEAPVRPIPPITTRDGWYLSAAYSGWWFEIRDGQVVTWWNAAAGLYYRLGPDGLWYQVVTPAGPRPVPVPYPYPEPWIIPVPRPRPEPRPEPRPPHPEPRPEPKPAPVPHPTPPAPKPSPAPLPPEPPRKPYYPQPAPHPSPRS